MSDGQMDLFGADSAEHPLLGAPSPSGVEPGQQNPPGLWIGCCAWNHPSFKNFVYPPGLPSAEELPYYARFCNAVEIDMSFYRVPTAEMVRRWAAAVPPGFRFAMKAPRSITHEAQLALDLPEARRDFDQLLAVLPCFGGKLAALLVQLGPSVTAARLPHLEKLLAALPAGLPVAVEFRHPTWNASETNGLLREKGAVRAWGDQYLDPRRRVAENAAAIWEATGPFRYVRLLGDVSTKYNRESGKRNFTYGSILFDRSQDLPRWEERLRPLLRDKIPVQLYINNHYEGFALLTAEKLRRALVVAV